MRESGTTRGVSQQHGFSRRDLLERAGLVAGLIGAPGLLLSACGESVDGGGGGGGGGRLEQLRTQGTITVGIAGEKPYAYLDGGELTGMDPSVQKKIWGNLGIENVKPQ
jgi:polar amino acid transport system substrate-binding protein